MAHSYHYFYIGDSSLSSGDFSREPPRLLTFSKIRNGPVGETSLHLHPHMEIFYFESGTGTLVSEDRRIPLHAHCLAVTNARNFHLQYSDDQNDPLVYYNFAVDRLNLPGCLPNTLSTEPVEFCAFEDENNLFFHIIEAILIECREKHYAYHSKVYALFSEFLIEMIRLFQKYSPPEMARTTSGAEVLIAVKDYIDLHYAESLDLDHLTQLSFMQKSHFLHSFKKHFGISPMKYLTLVRMENAKLLLLKSEKSVSEIAREIGYNTPSYFSEMFLKTVGESPTSYRKRVKKEI